MASDKILRQVALFHRHGIDNNIHFSYESLLAQMQKKTFGGQVPPLPASGPDAYTDAIGAVDVPLRGYGREHSDSIAAVRSALR